MNRPKMVVCGTTFGQVYLRALAAADSPAELAGVLARGSERSNACAEQYGVPLYTRVDDLPPDIDAACVVVRAAVVGGPGTELATELLNRGIHVLQEHPVHHDELAGCLRAARANGVSYRLNTHYPHLAPVRRFVTAAHALYQHGPPRYVDAAGGIQVAFALFDILADALPALRPWGFADPVPWPDELRRIAAGPPPLRTLHGVIGGVPLTLRMHNQLDPADPDNHAHLLHRVSIGTDAGNLTLVNTHGPVLWSPRLHVDPSSVDVDPRLVLASAEPVGDPDGPPMRAVLTELWPDATKRAIAELVTDIRTGHNPMRRGQYHLALCRIWQDVTSRLGHPELVGGTRPTPLSAADLTGPDLDGAWDSSARDSTVLTTGPSPDRGVA